jgi:hypothetical protein
MQRTGVFLAMAILAIMVMTPNRAMAQATGTISGTVVDTTGAVIAGAKVSITETNTDTTRALTTDSAGRYVGNLLQLGTYEVQVSASGFRPAEKVGLVLEAQGSPVIDFTLEPASTSSTVTVPVEVQTSDATLSQVIHSEQVADLPLNGRNFVELATLAPGVSAGDQPADFFVGGTSNSSEARFEAHFHCRWAGRVRKATTKSQNPKPE